MKYFISILILLSCVCNNTSYAGGELSVGRNLNVFRIFAKLAGGSNIRFIKGANARTGDGDAIVTQKYCQASFSSAVGEQLSDDDEIFVYPGSSSVIAPFKHGDPVSSNWTFSLKLSSAVLNGTQNSEIALNLNCIAPAFSRISEEDAINLISSYIKLDF